MRSKNVILCIALICLESLLQTAAGECPQTKGKLQRIGKTRFYIIHAPQRGDFVGFEGAKKVCAELGMVMAKIPKLTTLAMVGRELEEIVRINKLKDTWYWLDASYDEAKNVYMWDKIGEVKYSNFFYRQPRPTGVSGHVNPKHNYNVATNAKQCITLALPFPGIHEQTNGVYLGHSTSFDERACEGVRDRHAICESLDPQCALKDPSPFQIAEDKDHYFDDGNWIIGDRHYIINWAQRRKTGPDSSEEYCKSLGLQLYSPSLSKDVCLIPYIKMWSRFVTLSQFWTDWSYVAGSGEFLDKDGKSVANTSARIDFDSRSSKTDANFCVSMSHSYEMKDQQPCKEKKGPACQWNFINFVPANCNNYLGTICQPPTRPAAKCGFSSEYVQNVPKALNETATLPFGFKGNTETYRSRYKQTFGSLVCPTKFRMVRSTNALWSGKPSDPSFYKYDYMETYWTVDEGGFRKSTTSTCTVSKPSGDGFTRTLAKVPCTEWHFYLCEKIKRPEKAFTSNYNTPPSQPEWKPTIQPRAYPIIK